MKLKISIWFLALCYENMTKNEFIVPGTYSLQKPIKQAYVYSRWLLIQALLSSKQIV